MLEDDSRLPAHHRLAMEDEELVAHKFHNEMVKMVSRPDFERWRCSPASKPPSIAILGLKRFWRWICAECWSCRTDFLTILGFVEPDFVPLENEPGPIVDIPCEALIRIFDISAILQKRYHLSSFEDALYIGTGQSGAFRNAIVFGNGVTIPLQLLQEGEPVRILRRSWGESLEQPRTRTRGGRA